MVIPPPEPSFTTTPSGAVWPQEWLRLEALGRLAAGVDAASRVLRTLGEPSAVGDIMAHVDASVGVVTNALTRTAEALLRDADLAMYAAKAKGGAQYAVYPESLHDAVEERVRLESELRAAWNTPRSRL